MKNNNVVLINDISGAGHLDDWLNLYVNSLKKNKVEIFTIKKNSLKIESSNVNYFNEVNLITNIKINFIRLIQNLYRLLAREWKNSFSLQIYINYLLAKKNEVAQPIFFITYIDGYYMSFYDHFILNSLKNLQITGVLFEPNKKKLKLLGKLKSFRNLLVLDSRFVASSSDNLKLIFLPDIDLEHKKLKNKKNQKIVDEILKKINGRVCMGLGGNITDRKNIDYWSTIIKNFNEKKWFFIQFGKIDLSQNKKNELKNLQNKKHNFFIIDDYIERTLFNDLFNLTDIVFLCYKNFNFSSNFIYKAVYNRKIIFSNRSELINDTLLKYEIPFVESELNLKELEIKLLNFSTKKFNHARKNYLEHYNFDNFSKSIGESLLFK